MNQKLISVVVPVYNVESYICRCNDSILAQTYPTFELILTDDGSPDDSSAICDAYALSDSRILTIHERNGGLSAARNTGIDWAQQCSESKWITFIDSDDWIHPAYMNALLNGAVSTGSHIVIGSHIKTPDEVKPSDSVSTVTKWKTEDYWVKDRTNATVAWGKLYRRNLFDTIRYPVGKYHEDEFVTYRLLFQYEHIAVIDSPLYYYFVNEKSISGMNYMKRFPDILEGFSEHLSFFEKSTWKKAYRLEIEKYAEALSNAIYSLKYDKSQHEKTSELRKHLKEYLAEHKKMIPFETRKDIYISAYPSQEVFIRGFGFIKQHLTRKKSD